MGLGWEEWCRSGRYWEPFKCFLCFVRLHPPPGLPMVSCLQIPFTVARIIAQGIEEISPGAFQLIEYQMVLWKIVKLGYSGSGRRGPAPMQWQCLLGIAPYWGMWEEGLINILRGIYKINKPPPMQILISVIIPLVTAMSRAKSVASQRRLLASKPHQASFLSPNCHATSPTPQLLMLTTMG